MQFQPLSPQAFDALHGHSLLQAVYEALQAQLGSDTRYSAIELLPNAPASAKVAWYVWWFIAEAGGSGIPGYLANHVGSTAEVRSFRKALDAIGAVEAVRLLDAALALEEVASCLPPDDESEWYKQFRADPLWSSWEAIEGRSFELLSGAVSELDARYIREHRGELC